MVDGFDPAENGWNRRTVQAPNPDRKIIYRNGQTCVEAQREEPRTVEVDLPSEEEVLKARYGNIDRQLVIPRAESDSVDRTYVSNIGLFLRSQIVEESAPTGRSDFVKSMRHYSKVVNEIPEVIQGKVVTEVMNALADEAQAAMTNEEYEATREKARILFREMKIKKR